MAHLDFKVEHKNGNVSFVRKETPAQKRSSVPGQSIRVQCFDAEQVDRIFRYQENNIQVRESKHISVLKKILKF